MPARTSAAANKTVLVAGQKGETVNVQSQLATSHIAGNVTSHSNIGQVIGDLSKQHSTSSAWLEAENEKVSRQGQSDIARVLQQAKATEESLVLGAKEKQKAMDARYSAELAKAVQDLDLIKAVQLKELEDGLQRSIQSTLSTSKADINRVESEMNANKMDLLKQQQLRSAKEIDALSNLVVETKLTPSVTRTVIETKTQTGNVVAIATGGQISTGSATAATHSSQQIAAVPVAGALKQAADVTTGSLVQDSTGRKVGDAAIVNTQTRVVEQQQHQSVIAGGASAAHTASVVSTSSGVSRPLQADQQHATIVHPVTGAVVPLAAAHAEFQQKHSGVHTKDSEGLLNKTKHALGMEGKGDAAAGTEPRATSNTRIL